MQIAGDLLQRNADNKLRQDGIVATGYLAIARRFGHDIDADMHLTIEDTIDNLGKAYLGLTVSCARCHDHKYDPITADDYYALYGILQSTRLSYPDANRRGNRRIWCRCFPKTSEKRSWHRGERGRLSSIVK